MEAFSLCGEKITESLQSSSPMNGRHCWTGVRRKVPLRGEDSPSPLLVREREREREIETIRVEEKEKDLFERF